MYYRKKLLAVLMVLFSTDVFAGAGSAAEQIQTINEDVAVLNAQLAEMEVKAKIASKQQEISRLGAQAISSPSDQSLPVVRSIEGAGGRMQAQLAIGGGNTQTVIKGDKIGDWTVNQIDVNSVYLARGKQTVRLGFGTEPPNASSAPQGGVPVSGYR